MSFMLTPCSHPHHRQEQHQTTYQPQKPHPATHHTKTSAVSWPMCRCERRHTQDTEPLNTVLSVGSPGRRSAEICGRHHCVHPPPKKGHQRTTERYTRGPDRATSTYSLLVRLDANLLVQLGRLFIGAFGYGGHRLDDDALTFFPRVLRHTNVNSTKSTGRTTHR